MLRKLIENLGGEEEISISELKVGDVFKVYNKRLSASGAITKIKPKFVDYESKYMTGEMMKLNIRKSDMVGGQVARDKKIYRIMV